MFATNHAITGAIIGFTVTNPAVAIPAAFVSHFLLDALPHYGVAKNQVFDPSTTKFKTMLAIDAFFCLVLVAYLFLARPDDWLLPAVCAFVATSPDFGWLPDFWRAQQGLKPRPPTNPLNRFHDAIQRYQRPDGLIVEVIWLAVTLIVLSSLIR